MLSRTDIRGVKPCLVNQRPAYRPQNDQADHELGGWQWPSKRQHTTISRHERARSAFYSRIPVPPLYLLLAGQRCRGERVSANRAVVTDRRRSGRMAGNNTLATDGGIRRVRR